MKIKQKVLIAALLVSTTVLSRFAPHLWNMTPLAAAGILAGARLGLGWGIGVPLLGMFISDMFLGAVMLPVRITIYLSFALTGVVGYLVRNKSRVPAVLGGTILATAIFFFVTNAAVWLFGTMYPHDVSGLFMSYIAGLPFLQNQLLGDLFFTSALFAVWEAMPRARGAIYRKCYGLRSPAK